MKHHVRTAMFLAGCAVPLVAVAPQPARAAVVEHGYVDGSTAFFVSAGTQVDAPARLLEHATPIYLLTFPVAAGTTGPITLPSGYQPQENGNLNAPAPWHDHLLSAVPGASDYSPVLRVVVLRYSPAYAASLAFQPVTSVADLDAAEQAGKFVPIAPGAVDPFQLVKDDVLVRPVVRVVG